MPRRSVASWVSLDTQGPCFCPLRLFPLPSGNVKSQHCRHPSHSTRQRALSAPLRPAVICAVHCDLQRARAARLWPPIPAFAVVACSLPMPLPSCNRRCNRRRRCCGSSRCCRRRCCCHRCRHRRSVAAAPARQLRRCCISIGRKAHASCATRSSAGARARCLKGKGKGMPPTRLRADHCSMVT